MIYNGHISGREDLEFILKESLPKRAKVHFAWCYRIERGPKHNEYTVICYWSLDKRFYGAVAYRQILDGNATKWKVSVGMFNPRDAKKANTLKGELYRMQRIRKESGTDKITAIETALEWMVMQEEKWLLEDVELSDEVIHEAEEMPVGGFQTPSVN